MSADEYTTVRIPRELMEEVDRIVRHGLMGYRSRAEFVKEAIRDKLKTMLREPLQPPLEHFNLDEHGVRILDRTLANRATRGRIIDVYFKPEAVWCDYCKTSGCRHAEFALNVPEVQEILRKKGWKVAEG